MYLDVKNPYYSDYGASADDIIKLYEKQGKAYELPRKSSQVIRGEGEPYYKEQYNQFDFIRKNGSDEFTKVLKAEGYDGVIVGKENLDEIIAFYPKQIKKN